MDALEALMTRRSIRHYTSQAVPRDMIEKIVDAGRMAATACNEQPWEFVVVTDPAVRAPLAELSIHGKFIAEAPACIVVLSKEWMFFLEDGAAATQNLLVAARALGLGTCWISGDKKPTAPEILKLLGVPEGFRLISLVALGWVDPEARVRNPPKRALQEVLHWEKF
jgi:nitroreductase